MGVVAVVNGAGCPGATTSAVALAAGWPVGVVLADCDPGGGGIALGWCRRQVEAGELDLDVGVVSFVEATRHARRVRVQDLAPHLQTPARAPHVDLLVGVRAWRHGSRIDRAGWGRVADALVDAAGWRASQPGGRDVLADCGRLGPLTPWPVLESADLVLVAARPGRRQVVLACEAVAELAGRIPPRRLAVLVCASALAVPTSLSEATDVLPAGELPVDRAGAAQLLGDGWGWRRFERTGLGRSSRRVARRLHRRVHTGYVDAPAVRDAPLDGGV